MNIGIKELCEKLEGITGLSNIDSNYAQETIKRLKEKDQDFQELVDTLDDIHSIIHNTGDDTEKALSDIHRICHDFD